MERETVNITKKRDMILHGNLWKTILLISLPIAVGQMVIEVFALFDVYFSSTIGDMEMASSVFVGPINNVISSIGLGFGAACTALAAQEIGKKNYDKAKKIFVQLILLCILISSLLLLVCLPFSKFILKIGGAQDELMEVANPYFKIIILSLPLSFFNNIYFGMQRAIGNNRHIMITNASSIFIKFLLSYLFVIQCKFGLLGLGYSSLIANGIITLIAVVYICLDKLELGLKIRDFKISFPVIGMILLFSLPIIIEKSTQSFGNMIINRYATELGTNVLNAYGVINRVNSVVFSFASGFGTAIVTIIAQNYAVNNYQRVKQTKNVGMIISLGIVSILLAIILGLREVIANIYSHENENLKNSIMYGMSVYTISALPWTIMHIYFGVFQGIKKVRYTLVVSLCRLWLFRVVLVGILIYVFHWGEAAIWYGMLISNILAMLTALIFYLAGAKKSISKG